jgi:hypothetical protein
MYSSTRWASYSASNPIKSIELVSDMIGQRSIAQTEVSGMSQKIPFHEAKKSFKRLEPGLLRKETKAQRVARKRRESIPLERTESRELGLRDLNKSAERMLYDGPINRQAAKELK